MSMEWIKTSERLPEDEKTVLVYREALNDIIFAECLVLDSGHKRRWYYDRTEFFAGKDLVTHWQPLPKPPTEEATNDQAKE